MKAIVLFFFIAVNVLPLFAQSSESDSLYAKGVELYKSGNFNDAITLFSKVDSIDKKNKDVAPSRMSITSMWLASCYYKLNNIQKASEIYSNYRLSPVDRRLTIEIDSLLSSFEKAFKTKDFSTALSIISSCINICEDKLGKGNFLSSNMYLFKSEVLSQFGKYEDAIAAINEGLKIRQRNLKQYDGRYLQYLNNIANIYNKLGRDSNCLSTLKEQLEIINNNSIKLQDEERVLTSLYNNAVYLSDKLGLPNDVINIEEQSWRYVLGKYGSSSEKYFKESTTLIWAYDKYSEYLSTNQVDSAVRLCVKLLPLCEKLYGKCSNNYASLLDYYLRRGTRINKEEDIEKYCNEYLLVTKQLYGDKTKEYAIALSLVGSIYADYGGIAQRSTAYTLSTQGVKLIMELEGNESKEYMTLIMRLAHVLLQQDSISEASRLCEEAITISEKILDVNSFEYAVLLCKKGEICLASGDFLSAKNNLKEGFRIFDKLYIPKSHSLYLHYLYRLMDIERITENINEADAINTELLSLIEEKYGKESIDYANVLFFKLKLKKKMDSDYGNSLNDWIELSKLYERIKGDKSIEYALSLLEIGNDYLSEGNYSQGIDFVQKAADIAKRTIGEHNLGYADFLEGIAYSYQQIGDSRGALEAYKESLSIKEKFMGKNHPDYAYSLQKLGDFYRSFDVEAAKTYCEQSLKILEHIGYNEFSGHDAYIDAIMTYASVLQQMSNFTESIRLYEKALRIVRNKYGTSHRKYLAAMRGLADIYIISQSDLNKGYELAKQVVSLHKESNDLFYRHDLERVSLAASLLRDKDKTIEFSTKTSKVTADIIFNNLSSMPKRNREAFYSWCVDWYRRQFVYVLHSDSTLRESELLYDGALMCKGLLLGVEKRDLTKQDMNKLHVSWKDVKGKLKEGDIAIEFFKIPLEGKGSNYHALVIKKGYNIPHIIDLFFYDESTLAEKEQSDICQELWSSLSNELSGVMNVYFSPDGILYNIPIEAVLHWDGKCFLSDHFNLYRLSSTRELVLKESIENIKNASVYGGVKYDTKEDLLVADSKRYQSGERSLSYEPFEIADSLNMRSGAAYLPATKVEAEEIDKTLEQKKIATSLKLDTLATEGAFKDLSGKRTNLLHIATHGFYWTEKEAKFRNDLSFLMLGDNQPRYVEDKALTRSGLLLAGANNALMGKKLPEGVNDGILTAKEISQLDLRGLDLVVLSACQTGLGEIKGDGVFGLQRGFKKAGANSLLMSLWKVDDEATRLLMTQFYKNLTSGMSKYESLKQAQKYVREYEVEVEVKSDTRPSVSAHAKQQAQQNTNKEKEFKKVKKYQNPYYWAAFILLDAID